MAARRRDEDRGQQRVVAADVAHVRRLEHHDVVGIPHGLGQRRDLGTPGQDVRHLDQRVRGDDLDALDQRRLARPRRGTTIRASPCARAPCATASAPRIGRSSPVSDSSPANTQSSTCSRSTCPLAARIDIASGRSKPGPILRR